MIMKTLDYPCFRDGLASYLSSIAQLFCETADAAVRISTVQTS